MHGFSPSSATAKIFLLEQRLMLRKLVGVFDDDDEQDDGLLQDLMFPPVVRSNVFRQFFFH